MSWSRVNSINRASRTLLRVCSVALVVAPACKDSTGVSTDVAASLTLIPSLVELDALGATQEMQVTVRDALGKELSGIEITWAIDNTAIASIDSDGMVTAEGVGTAQVTATSGSISRSSSIEVTQVPRDVEIVSGDGQSATVASALPDPLVVRVTDRLSNAIGGAAVSFTVSQGTAATLSVSSATADANGQASTQLTLGTQSGAYEVTAFVTTAGSRRALFDATGLADQPTAAAVAGGDGQRQPAGSTLPSSLVVLVTDQYGNGVPGQTVNFAVNSGGGSISPASATTDQDGRAVAQWSLGSTIGPQTAEGAIGGLTGSPVPFSATGTDLAVQQISPNPLIEGQAATITGTGFDPAIVDNTVLVAGLPATITSASPTSLAIVVPTEGCRPASNADVIVTSVSGGTTPAISHPFEPAPLLNMAVGEPLIIEDPNDFCLNFSSASASEEYLLGVQAVSDAAATLTDVHITGVTPGGLAPMIVAQSFTAHKPVTRQRTARSIRWEEHREAEVDFRLRAEQAVRTRGRGAALAAFQSAAALSAASVDSTVQPGQVVSFRMPNLTTNVCQESIPLTAVVKVVGAKGIWLEDTDNPGGGFSAGDYQSLSDQLDNSIYDTNVSYFGDPTDIDGNGRILILITEKINNLSNTTLGFVSPADLVSPTECPASQQAEVYYNRAPTTLGYSRDDAIVDAPLLIAHEFTHIIQSGRRLVVQQGDFMDLFMAEGQATYAEEVNGHVVNNLSAGQNYGYMVAFNQPSLGPVTWYTDAFIDVSFYFGRNQNDPDTPIPGAPARCSWVTRTGAPCGGRALWYGVTWSLLRWISDNFPTKWPGGEQEFQRLLIDNDKFGFENIEDVVGEPIEQLLAKWAASLYLDDRGVSGLPTEYTFSSWNFKDVLEDGSLPSSSALVPSQLSFGDFTTLGRVRSGSTAYFLIQGSNRPATSVRLRNGNDDPLPDFTQIFLVRTK